MFDTTILNCTIVAPHRTFKGWVGIRDGSIAATGTGAPDSGASERTIDGHGNYLLPGRVEPHVHIRATCFNDDLIRMSTEALAGGVTTLMPYMRSADSYLDRVPDWSDSVRQKSLCDVAFHLQIQSLRHIDEIVECHRRFGIACYKVHIDARHNLTTRDFTPVDDGELFLTMLEVRKFDGLVAVHCEDTEIARYLATGLGVNAGGDVRGLNWSEIRPPLVEAADVNTAVFLAHETGARILIVHVSTGKSVAVAERQSLAGVHLETLIQQLTITEAGATARLGHSANRIPPLRGDAECDALWEAIRDHRIGIVGTDHNAVVHTGTSTDGPLLEGSAAPVLGCGLPLLLTEGLRRGMNLSTLVEVMSASPAQLFGISDTKGSIAPGMDADLVLVDLATARRVERGTPASPHVSLAEGLLLRGWPVWTMLRGRGVFADGQVAAEPGFGQVVHG